jgi:hypothetical protein
MSLSDQEASQMQEAVSLIGRFLPLEKWNLKQTAQFVAAKYVSAVIYDSDKCRIIIYYEAVPSREYERNFSFYYGRLGLRDNAGELSIGTKLENIHLYWHGCYYPFYFLDGLSPRETKGETEPRLIREIKQSELVKGMLNVPEKELVMQAEIWKNHGQQLFNIFDARNEDLWERYCAFLREFWKELSRFP